jgi:5-methylcytosine-specific restriction protein A
MTSGKWATSKRREELPPDWPALRQATFDRDGKRCTWKTNDMRCDEPATQCDHVVPGYKGGTHDLSNLTSLCEPHHRKKSAMEGVQARAERREAARRPPERHPSTLRPAAP